MTSGAFHCPRCAVKRPYDHKRIRRFFTLYFIPLIPLEHLGEYIECQHCRGSYKPEVLDYDPQANQAAIEAEFQRAVDTVVIAIAMVGEGFETDKIERIRLILGRMKGEEFSTEDIQAKVDAPTSNCSSAEDQLKRLAPTLNDNGKEIIIKAAIMAAAGGGSFSDEQTSLLLSMASSLGMSPAHLQGVMKSLSSDST